MEHQPIIDGIKTVIKPLLEQKNIDLVSITYRQEGLPAGRQGRRMVLRLLVDKKGGITLDECAVLNEEISAILDKDDAIATSYILEVASPGLDRPLTTKEDFERTVDKKMEIFLKEPLKDKLSYTGRLKAVKENSITLELEGAESVDIPLDIINRGKLKIEFSG